MFIFACNFLGGQASLDIKQGLKGQVCDFKGEIVLSAYTETTPFRVTSILCRSPQALCEVKFISGDDGIFRRFDVPYNEFDQIFKRVDSAERFSRERLEPRS